MKFSGPTWNLLYGHFFQKPKQPDHPFHNRDYSKEECQRMDAFWKPIHAAENAWEKTRKQRKKEGWIPNPHELAKVAPRDLRGLGRKGEKEIRSYLKQHGLTLHDDIDALLRKEQTLINMIESLRKALEETQWRMRHSKENAVDDNRKLRCRA